MRAEARSGVVTRVRGVVVSVGVMGSTTVVRAAGPSGGKGVASVDRVLEDVVQAVIVEVEAGEGVGCCSAVEVLRAV